MSSGQAWDLKAATPQNCSGCGVKLPPGAKFCGECGAKVVE